MVIEFRLIGKHQFNNFDVLDSNESFSGGRISNLVRLDLRLGNGNTSIEHPSDGLLIPP